MKKGQLKIYLFRHGETTHNRDGIFTGSIDAKLTLKGKNHAKIIAKILKRKKFQAAIHTKLSRSKETLKQVLNKMLITDLKLTGDYILLNAYPKYLGEKT